MAIPYMALYISFPLLFFIVSLLDNIDEYDYKFNAYAYFTYIPIIELFTLLFAHF